MFLDANYFDPEWLLIRNARYCQILGQRRRQQPADLAASRQARMIRLDRYLAFAGEFEKLRRIDALEPEPDKLHRADFFV